MRLNLLFLITVLFGSFAFGQTYIKGGTNSALIETPTLTATAAGNTSLTKDSNSIQNFTGSTTQTIFLPNATTLPLGRYFEIYNTSTGAVTIQDASNNPIYVLQTGSSVKLIVKNIGSTAGAWIIQKVDPFPSLAGNSGKYLSNDGTSVFWDDVDALPSQTGNNGKYLTTDGSTASWATVDSLPSQATHSGQFLTTNGTVASWATVDALPAQSGQSGKVLKTNGSAASWQNLAATEISYDGTSSGLPVNNVQSAIDSLDTTIDGIVLLPTQSGQAGKYLSTNGTSASWLMITKKVYNLTATGTIAADAEYVSVDATSGSVTLTLPASSTGKELEIIRIDNVEANTVTLTRAGSDQILTEEGLATTFTLVAQGTRAKLTTYATNRWGVN